MKKNKEQKIYIDVDEEITTVVDYLRKAEEKNIILVVPQHALILQSVVNLRLLAQEAKKRKKILTIMTRDEEGIAFAARAGIAVQPFVSRDDEIWPEKPASQIPAEEQSVTSYAQKVIENKETQRMPDHLGTPSFFDAQTSQSFQEDIDVPQKDDTHFSVQKKSRMDMTSTLQVSGIVAPKHSSSQPHSQKIISQQGDSSQSQAASHVSAHSLQHHQLHHVQENQNTADALEEYEQSLNEVRLQQNHQPQAQSSLYDLQQYENSQHTINNDKNKKNYKKEDYKKNKKGGNVSISPFTQFALKGFLFGGIALIIIIILIIILPWTKISIEPKKITIDEKMQMTAQTDQTVYDADRRLIPARLIERDVTFTKTFNATGKGDVKAQKAQGTITIVNEFSEEPQPLVATTRFLAQNGTLFRLVNQTVVPGMKDGVPGKVDALVIADEAGEQGNIGPTSFTIPGFEGTPKYEKFHAVSDKPMTGGGAGGNNVTIVTADDIKNAQEEMTKELPSYITQQISGLLRPDDEVLLDNAMTYEIVRSEANMNEGTMTDQFMYEIVAHVKALVFSQQDVLDVMESNLSTAYHQYSADQVQVDVKYNDVNADFDDNSLEITAHAMANDIVATVDVDAFENDILGKKHDEILPIMESAYNDEIEKVTIESVVPSFPPFIANHISRFSFMTHIFVQ